MKSVAAGWAIENRYEYLRWILTKIFLAKHANKIVIQLFSYWSPKGDKRRSYWSPKGLISFPETGIW
ncbi:hypothetical protein A4R26_01645 [Niastella populi]|uniref:Uncharacterized protein n=1 Tax=Niastella populi TaxID=550983 RepID=A0A1V9GD81_9BACT|nr:hypothetical protein A4R26_01645 [Niastella populi]